MSHYFINDTKVLDKPRKITYKLEHHSFVFHTNEGVFSKDRVDYGSDVLIRAVLEQERKQQIPVGKDLLFAELGCGYGPIAISILKSMEADGVGVQGRLYEVNERAGTLAMKNLEENHIVNGNVILGDLTQVDEIKPCHICVTNPPIRAGKDVVWKFFEIAYHSLEQGGRFYCVIQKNQGAASAKKRLVELFGICDIIERSAGYHVLRSIRSDRDRID